MKIHYLFFTLILTALLFNCKPEIVTPFIPKNHLAEFQTEKSQIFDLDTISFEKIKGKHGTKINFNRDLFDIEENAKIQLELIELYDFKEILYQNIQTLTTDNKLLESSGVLKIKFTVDGKEIQLKKGKKLMIETPEGKLGNNDIFLSELDSLEKIKWKITNQNYINFDVYKGGGITVLITIPRDSLDYYIQQQKKYNNQLKKEDLVKNELIRKSNLFILQNINSKWINIDRIVNTTSKINFELYNDKKEFSGFNTYITYQDLSSFLYYPITNNNLFFYDIPIKGKVKITVIGENKNGIFYDQIELNKALHNSKLKLNLKKISKEGIKKIFDKVE
ncbi:hypothetical protein [Tenacibaculum sp. M341]|uniref:hypothetical protein n=1 Tax=Tenacibaculum sp. M341 TaxID=2530339 RepID=UPI001042AD59|nr:hypothetical protein [Tenacibaculum sp. M341]TCI90155.1 hypothetical protein EYW44_14575 [Tenacibaculum sp. M341]